MNRECNFYICPICFSTCEMKQNCHGEVMIHCANLPPGDNRLKPIMKADGSLKSRAPRWFLENRPDHPANSGLGV